MNLTFGEIEGRYLEYLYLRDTSTTQSNRKELRATWKAWFSITGWQMGAFLNKFNSEARINYVYSKNVNTES